MKKTDLGKAARTALIAHCAPESPERAPEASAAEWLASREPCGRGPLLNGRLDGQNYTNND